MRGANNEFPLWNLADCKASIARNASYLPLPQDCDELTTSFITASEKESEVGEALGNAVCANVFERILSRLLVAANLVPQPLPDHWAQTEQYYEEPEAKQFL